MVSEKELKGTFAVCLHKELRKKETASKALRVN